MIGKRITYHILKNLSANQRDFILSLKRLNLRKKEHPQKQLFIIIFDGKFFHGGLGDRFKGIISIFHYCICNGINFKINHIHPFDLSNYLIPNKYNWKLISSDRVSTHLFETKFINLIGENLFKRLIRLNTKKQIHCYANRDIVSELNVFFHTNYDWGELFKKLFKPSHELAELIHNYKLLIGGRYICAVFRFQHLLGDFKEYNYTELTDNEKNTLIKKCRQAIIDLQQSSDCKKILVTSDSVLFLQNVQGMNNVYVFPGKIVHIDTVEEEKHNVYMKSFLDFYMLSEGIKIYSIGTKLMYRTEFPLYASKLNNIPFERILIE